MEDVRVREKFTVKITESGLVIVAADECGEKHLHFTAGEALMLLDILKNEEEGFKQMAEKKDRKSTRLNSSH